MKLMSEAFSEEQIIPSRFTCDGEDISPPLAWSDVPAGTASLALICHDPDAGKRGWTHWVLYDLPAECRSLPQAVKQEESGPEGSRQGRTDFRKIGYGGPCPPRGTHRYYFRLYALDIRLEAAPGLTGPELLEAMEGHVLAEASLMGRYGREPIA